MMEKPDGFDLMAHYLRTMYGRELDKLPQDREPTGYHDKGDYLKSLNRFSSKESLYGSSRMELDEDGDLVSVNDQDEVLDLVEDRADSTNTARERCMSPYR